MSVLSRLRSVLQSSSEFQPSDIQLFPSQTTNRIPLALYRVLLCAGDSSNKYHTLDHRSTYTLDVAEITLCHEPTGWPDGYVSAKILKTMDNGSRSFGIINFWRPSGKAARKERLGTSEDPLASSSSSNMTHFQSIQEDVLSPYNPTNAQEFGVASFTLKRPSTTSNTGSSSRSASDIVQVDKHVFDKKSLPSFFSVAVMAASIHQKSITSRDPISYSTTLFNTLRQEGILYIPPKFPQGEFPEPKTPPPQTDQERIQKRYKENMDSVLHAYEMTSPEAPFFDLLEQGLSSSVKKSATISRSSSRRHQSKDKDKDRDARREKDFDSSFVLVTAVEILKRRERAFGASENPKRPDGLVRSSSMRQEREERSTRRDDDDSGGRRGGGGGEGANLHRSTSLPKPRRERGEDAPTRKPSTRTRRENGNENDGTRGGAGGATVSRSHSRRENGDRERTLPHRHRDEVDKGGSGSGLSRHNSSASRKEPRSSSRREEHVGSEREKSSLSRSHSRRDRRPEGDDDLSNQRSGRHRDRGSEPVEDSGRREDGPKRRPSRREPRVELAPNPQS